MVLGIVGAEGAKFTEYTEQKARRWIRDLLDEYEPALVVSGACHLGGIDVWAVQEAQDAGIAVREYPPKVQRWEGGYKQRNLQIVAASTCVVCITVQHLPPGYKGMRFASCYHCKSKTHVKSGGCWTMHQARKAGKQWRLIEIASVGLPLRSDA